MAGKTFGFSFYSIEKKITWYIEVEIYKFSQNFFLQIHNLAMGLFFLYKIIIRPTAGKGRYIGMSNIQFLSTVCNFKYTNGPALNKSLKETHFGVDV